MARDISSSANIIDSRDVEERINELEEEINGLKEEVSEIEEKIEEMTNEEGSEENEDLQDKIDDLKADIEEKQDEISELESELKPLQEMREDCGHPDWPHGLTLVNEDYWEDFARDEAESLYGSEIRDAHWPFDCIDWEKAAEALQMDYSQLEYEGVTFYYRS